MSTLHLLIIIAVVGFPAARPNSIRYSNVATSQEDAHDYAMHTISSKSRSGTENANRAFSNLIDESDTAYWKRNAQASLQSQAKRKLNTNKAKNLIMFLGDGLSIPNLMAARTYLGQLQGNTGEESKLYWENFPYTGLSKTYCVDYQVPDSACTATAYLCGIKANFETIGVNAKVPFEDCEAMLNSSNHVTSIAEWAQNSGKAVGIVTNTRVTHASPAGAYANTASRNWESDKNIIDDGLDPTVCTDIATQLITNNPGKDFQVILGGGRREFLPNTTIDDEGTYGYRKDGVDLIEVWKKDKADRQANYNYVWNRKDLRQIIKNPDSTDYLLGLFEASHCTYHKEGSPETEPTLAEMTQAAIKILEKDVDGYFLFVEGGRIDHAHHDSYAHLALDETVELAAAVRMAREMSSEEDTLIVVTSDHAHTMSVSGYPLRGNDILGIAANSYIDDLPYTTLSYANGPGYRSPDSDGNRYNISNDDLTDVRYEYPAMVPLASETHGGDDVPIFADGPWSHLFSGTLEQHYIPHFMAYAACIGDGLTACTNQG